MPVEPALYFAPPDDTPWLAPEDPNVAQPQEERRPRWDNPGEHPVLRGVDPRHAPDRSRTQLQRSIPDAHCADVPGDAARVCPRFAGSPPVVVGFGVADSNLAYAPAFPVFMANTLEWLARPEIRDLSLRPGLTSFAGPARITRDDGESVPLTRVTDIEYAVLYDARLLSSGNCRGAEHARCECRRPAAVECVSHDAWRRDRCRPPLSPLERPWWLGCAMAGFVLAFAEWWTWQRRVTV